MRFTFGDSGGPKLIRAVRSVHPLPDMKNIVSFVRRSWTNGTIKNHMIFDPMMFVIDEMHQENTKDEQHLSEAFSNPLFIVHVWTRYFSARF
jgi:hypothetical protein